jgi:TolB-like protein
VQYWEFQYHFFMQTNIIKFAAGVSGRPAAFAEILRWGSLVAGMGILLLTGSCGSAPQPAGPPVEPPLETEAAKVPEAPGNAGDPVSLDRAIQDAARNIEAALERGSKVAVLNVNSDSESLADHIIEELTGTLVNGKKLVITDRKNLELIREEMQFQLSGDVSDESMQAIGKMLGAEYIVSGSFTNLGGTFRFRARTINVTTAVIETQSSTAVLEDSQISFLIEKDKPPEQETMGGLKLPAPREPTEKTGGDYRIGDWGPAGGIVFYDKGKTTDGWRYLEAAPKELEAELNWIATEQYPEKLPLSGSMGSGKKNTAVIVEFLEAIEENYRDSMGIPINAAPYCAALDYDGFQDWFLPGIEELELMEKNLWQNGWGDFAFMQVYWSSSLAGDISDSEDYVVWVYDFYGEHARRRGVEAGYYTKFLVRPVRAF